MFRSLQVLSPSAFQKPDVKNNLEIQDLLLNYHDVVQFVYLCSSSHGIVARMATLLTAIGLELELIISMVRKTYSSETSTSDKNKVLESSQQKIADTTMKFGSFAAAFKDRSNDEKDRLLRMLGVNISKRRVPEVYLAELEKGFAVVRTTANETANQFYRGKNPRFPKSPILVTNEKLTVPIDEEENWYQNLHEQNNIEDMNIIKKTSDQLKYLIFAVRMALLKLTSSDNVFLKVDLDFDLSKDDYELISKNIKFYGSKELYEAYECDAVGQIFTVVPSFIRTSDEFRAWINDENKTIPKDLDLDGCRGKIVIDRKLSKLAWIEIALEKEHKKERKDDWLDEIVYQAQGAQLDIDI